jgi:hypothetical protein
MRFIISYQLKYVCLSGTPLVMSQVDVEGPTATVSMSVTYVARTASYSLYAPWDESLQTGASFVNARIRYGSGYEEVLGNSPIRVRNPAPSYIRCAKYHAALQTTHVVCCSAIGGQYASFIAWPRSGRDRSTASLSLDYRRETLLLGRSSISSFKLLTGGRIEHYRSISF